MRFAPALRFLRRRSVPVVHQQDPADLGTAFGMEASLEEDGDYETRSKGYAVLESQRAHPAIESPMDWVRKRRPNS
jgi:hypothetical protein